MAAGPHGNRNTHPGPSISRAQRDCQDRVIWRLAVEHERNVPEGADPPDTRIRDAASERLSRMLPAPRRAGQARLMPQKIGGPITRSTKVRLRAMIDK